MFLQAPSAASRWNIFHAVAAALRGDRTAYPLGYMASFDGSRGLMTLGVLLAHTRIALFPGAMIYMDVFFTMSGYLITSILIKDYRKHGQIRLTTFYLRRFMRLYPALIVMVVCLLAIFWVKSPIFETRLLEGVFTLLYLVNIPWTWWLDYTYTGHTWSLAVEEQFYLIWPLILIGLLRMGGICRRTAIAIFAMAAMFWGWRIVMALSGVSLKHLYNCIDARADSLLLGCGLAVLLQVVDLNDHPRLWRLCAQALLPIMLVLLMLGFVMKSSMSWYYYVSPLFGAIPGAISIVGLLHPQRTLMHRLYDHPVLVFCGRICYGLYIWHFPIFMWISSWATPRYITVFLLGWPLTFAAATLSYYFIERPFMRARPAI